MSEFIDVPCKGNFIATIVERKRVLPTPVQSRVDEIWDREFQVRQGKLFNGSILGIVKADMDDLLVEKTEYKIVLALVRDPSLKEAIDFKPLCTSGMTLSSGKVLLGQRAQYVSAYPNFYEMVPSGSIDSNQLQEGLTIDLKQQLLQELAEEADIASSFVEKSEGWTLIYDAENKMYEVVARIYVPAFFSSSPVKEGEGEYRSLLWLAKEELEKHLIQHKDHYVPLTKYLYTKWNSLISFP